MFKPNYIITPLILKQLNRIEVIRGEINRCPIHPKQEYRLKREAVLSMVHHSTAIEGNTLTEIEVRKVLERKSVHASSREIYEVKNYKKALDWIAGKKTLPITPKDILKIHDMIMKNILPKEKCGCFRIEPVYVVRRTPLIQEIRYTAPNHKKVSGLIKNLCDWIEKSRKDELSPALIAGIAHAEIAAIHPFPDGNGRTARLLATMILYTEKYDFRKLFALDNYYSNNRPAYYDAIHLGNNYQERSKGNLTKWTEYFTTGFLCEMELVMDKVRPFLYLKNQIDEKVILNEKEIKILDFLNEMQQIKSSDVENILTVSKRTAQRYLAKLIEKKLIKKQGGKKDAVYLML